MGNSMSSKKIPILSRKSEAKPFLGVNFLKFRQDNLS
jgi:hypothetical protein